MIVSTCFWTTWHFTPFHFFHQMVREQHHQTITFRFVAHHWGEVVALRSVYSIVIRLNAGFEQTCQKTNKGIGWMAPFHGACPPRELWHGQVQIRYRTYRTYRTYRSRRRQRKPHLESIYDVWGLSILKINGTMYCRSKPSLRRVPGDSSPLSLAVETHAVRPVDMSCHATPLYSGSWCQSTTQMFLAESSYHGLGDLHL